MDRSAESPSPKAGLRRQLLAARTRRPSSDLEQAGRPLADAVLAWLGPAGRVCLYLSVGGEPPTGALLAALAGREVLLPVLLPDGDLDWARWEGEARRAACGLLEPVGVRLGPSAVAGADALVVPALAAGRDGSRLGRGGGSYDRVLARVDAPSVALLFDGELLDSVPVEPHDRPVTAVATPSLGVVATGARMG